MENLKNQFNLVDLGTQNENTTRPNHNAGNYVIDHFLVSKNIENLIEKETYCDQCPVILKVKTSLKIIDNYKEFYNDNIYESVQHYNCHLCDSSTTLSLRNLKAHLKNHFKQNCPECGLLFYSVERLKIHFSTENHYLNDENTQRVRKITPFVYVKYARKRFST